MNSSLRPSFRTGQSAGSADGPSVAGRGRVLPTQYSKIGEVDLKPQPRGQATFMSIDEQDMRMRLCVALFASTMFVGSGLLFLVQPMFARLLLPRLGGSASVWNACVLFFQTALLIGYLYAHFSTKWLGVRRQSILHAAVVLIPLLFLPLSAGVSVPTGDRGPVSWLLVTMIATVGVPFVVLSTTAPLLQRWLTAMPVTAARDPYFLYAASNLGSMLALLGYPFLIEPAMGVVSQTRFWSAGYVLFIAMVSACLYFVHRFESETTDGAAEAASAVLSSAGDTGTVPAASRLKWITYAFVPSSLMLGVTLHISTDIASVPLFWVLPLALYLLTFVAAFSQGYLRLKTWAAQLATPLILVTLLSLLLNVTPWWFLALHLTTFFVCALVCHTELAASRPQVSHLTEFYIWISVGGMLGGAFNTLIAPVVFATVFEYPLLLAASTFLVPSRHASLPRSIVLAGSLILVACIGVLATAPASAMLFRVVAVVAIGATVPLALARAWPAFRAPAIALLVVIALWPLLSAGSLLFSGRSFFGVVRVTEAADHSHRILRHGSTVHGRQQLPAEDRCEPAGYHHPNGPIGRLFNAVSPHMTDVGVVGLGAGGLACYAHSGQRWTFFEIDPLVETVATNRALFTHLRNSEGEMRVEIGDGRIGLQRAAVGTYDLIIIDAFSSDAVPVHLLTDEAVELYVSRLKPRGLLVLHISNRYLRLERVVTGISQRQSLHVLSRFDSEIPRHEMLEGRTASHWVAIAREPETLAPLSQLAGWTVP